MTGKKSLGQELGGLQRDYLISIIDDQCRGACLPELGHPADVSIVQMPLFILLSLDITALTNRGLSEEAL